MPRGSFLDRNTALWLAENAPSLWGYVPRDSGIVWLIQTKGVPKKKNSAGGKQLKYYSVRYKGIYYYCHHVVWTLQNGLIPENFQIDHIDRNGHNNTIENLALKTQSSNAHNKRPTGRSGYKGVSYFRRDDKWLARLGTPEGLKFLGYYETALEAALVWDKAAVQAGRFPEDLNFPELI
jgi:hypothetical protein